MTERFKPEDKLPDEGQVCWIWTKGREGAEDISPWTYAAGVFSGVGVHYQWDYAKGGISYWSPCVRPEVT